MQKRRSNIDKKIQGQLLLLQVPRTSDKLMESAEYLFTSLFTLLNNDIIGGGKYNQRLSFEIAFTDKTIGFYIWVPQPLRQFIEEQIYSQYPTVQIFDVKDYVNLSNVKSQLITEIRLAKDDYLPIKYGSDFKIDPLSLLTSTLSELNHYEEVWIQIIITPAYSQWHNDALKFSKTLNSPRPTLMKTILGASPADFKVTDQDAERSRAVIAKNEKPAFQTTIRIVYRGDAKLAQAKIRLQAIATSFLQFNTPNYNMFKQVFIGDKTEYINDYRSRFPSSWVSILNVQELAGIYHLPHSAIDTPNISWASSKSVEPPANLPTVDELTPEALKSEVSLIAYTDFRGNKQTFGLARADRSRHLYILGQTGVGKSALLELLTIADINSPYGFAIIDPHGDYAVNILRRIPKSRIDDVVYINPADIDYPIAFNPLEVTDQSQKNHITNELINVLQPIFEDWNPRLEYTLRNSILALLDFPNSTMLDIPRLLSDVGFRDDVVSYIKDLVVGSFWRTEFEQWAIDYGNIAVEPIINKIGAFTSNPIIKNILDHPKSSFNIRQIMDERKILIVNLSRGLVGEDNAALLGSLIVASMKRSAMSRADIDDIDQRIPFYLYVDEFQNFATDSFKTILSEARKYGLILTVANQYIEQMSPSVQDAIFGNVGSMIAFRLSANDAKSMVKYFEPHFTDHDLINLHNRHIIINMTIDGNRIPSFAAETINLPAITENNAVDIINASRAKYASEKKSEIDSSYFAPKTHKAPNLDKDEIVKDLGHYIRTKLTTETKPKKSKKNNFKVKKLISKRIHSTKIIDFDEDKSINLH
jgi:hypothetical protein